MLGVFSLIALVLVVQDSSESAITEQKLWANFDSLLDSNVNQEIEFAVTFHDGRTGRRILHVGKNLAESRTYSETQDTSFEDVPAKKMTFTENLYRENEFLRVWYTKEEGKPLLSPEQNVHVSANRSTTLSRFGLFPDFIFGFLSTGTEIIDLRREEIRKQFRLENIGHASMFSLERTNQYGAARLVFRLVDNKLLLASVETKCDQPTDERFSSSEAKFHDLRFDDLGRLIGFAFESSNKWHPDMIPPPYKSEFIDGWSKVSQINSLISISAWQPEKLPLGFKTIPVPDGFPAGMIGEPGVKYEYHDGELVLVVNQTAQNLIEAMKEVASPSRILDGTFWKKELDKFLVASKQNRRQDPDEVAGYCGLYSIAAAVAVHGKSIEFSKLLSSNYIQSTLGSTAEELQQAIADNDLFSQLVFHASPIYLKNSQSPVLLHLGNNYSSGAPQHWVLYLGQDAAGNAVILDTPQSIESLPFAALQTHWDGTAIAISDQPVSRVAQVKTWLGGIFPLALSVLLLTTASLFAQRSAANSVTTALLLAGVIFVGCVIWSVYDPSAFWKNATPVALTESKVRRELEIDEVNDVDQLRKEGVLLVDARTPRDFSMGSLPGAVNLPVNPTLGTLISVVGQAKQSDRVIVYCQSEDCKWSDTVGGKLKTMGIERVSVFRPGWRGFVEKMRAGRSPSGVKE